MCVISQPRFFPGLHYLHRMMVADIFVILDTVQFSPRHEENRTRLKSPQGPQWLTVPMRKFSRSQLIQDTVISDDQPWQRKSTKTLSNLYSRAPYYATYAPEVLTTIEAPYKTLTELAQASWEPALKLLGITCKFIYSSELPAHSEGPQLLLDICRYLGVETYLSGSFGREYINVAEFGDAGVKAIFHEYTYPIYPQRFGDFVPFLSYVDMLFNVGLDREKVLAGGKMLPA